MAVDLAKKNGTKLHILHISTAKELTLFDNSIPLEQKKITSEACIHHMWFNRDDYKEKGTLIKWNPAVKEESDRQAIIRAVNDNVIDVIATDHAPHNIEEKQNTYFKAPSGGPLVQHSIQALLDMVKKGWFTIEKVVEKMAHHPAILFQVDRRGFIREGYWADLVLVDPNQPQQVSKENILYKCGWSPFEGHTFSSTITHTIISGVLKWENGRFCSELPGERVLFERG
jgi:dihydroorotase